MKSYKMAILAAGLIAASHDAAAQSDAPFIGKHNIAIENGRMTPEALWAMGRIGSSKVSPDGKTIAYTVTYYSKEQNKSHSVIYTMNADGSNNKMLTTIKGGEYEPTWIKNGAKIAFLTADENGTMQIFEMNADGSERKQLSFLKKDVEGFSFSPDGQKVLYVASIPYHHSIQENDADLPKSTGMVVTDLMYKHWDEYVTSIPHPYVTNFVDGKVTEEGIDLLQGEGFESPMKPFGGMEQLAWSPDSKTIAYTCRKKEGKEYAFSTDSDIFLYDVATGKTENLCKDYTADKNMGYDINPAFSPDGKLIAWQSMERDGYESDRNRLCVMDLQKHTKTYVTEDFDSGVDGFVWNSDSKSLYFYGVWHGVSMIYSTNLKGNVKQITEGQYDFTISQLMGDKLLIGRHSMMEPDELYTLVPQTKKITQLTTENKHIMDQLHKGKVEPRWTTTTDGKQMLSWVIYPSDFNPNKKYPTLLFCEGGPQSPVSQFWSYRWNFQIMAANDYIIIAPNRRGLPGFGQEWLEQISGDYGGQCMKDYLTAIDDLCKESYVDKDRLGCVGASFGGFSVYWLAGNHDKRFKAFIAHDGIYNIEQQYVETEEMWFAQWDMKGAPWEKNNAAAQKTFAASPHLFVDKWDTPILCIQGEKDFRITTNQGESAFNAAVIRGIPAELLQFPDENHWVLKPQNGILWQRTFFRWLDKWLKK
ncbi:MAG: S9 family peptidase [Bacteroidales bacterium]|nr:S9 family peptidase [Candidatus Minthousia equi]